MALLLSKYAAAYEPMRETFADALADRTRIGFLVHWSLALTGDCVSSTDLPVC